MCLSLFCGGLAFGDFEIDCGGTPCEKIMITSDYGCASGWYVINYGLYEDQTAANAALTGAGYTYQGVDTYCTGISYVWGKKSGGTCGNGWFMGGWYYKTGEWAYCYEDGDEDGLNDNYDPYPDDDTPFTWSREQEVRDETGKLRAVWIKTDRGDSFWIGDRAYAEACYAGENSCQTRMFINIGGPQFPYDPSELAAYFEGEEVDDIETEDGGQWGPVNPVDNGTIEGEATGMTPGEQSDSETGDTALRKIIDNTGATADNTSRLGDYIVGVQSKLDGVVAGLGKVAEGIDGLTGGSGGSVGEGVSEGLGDYFEGVDDETSDEQGDITAFDPEVEIDGSNFEEGDAVVPKATGDNAITGLLNWFLANNPLLDLADMVGINTSGAVCSIDESIFIGSVEIPISLSLCEYEDQIENLGFILLGFAGLLGALKFFE
jgi:hypothetical protein